MGKLRNKEEEEEGGPLGVMGHSPWGMFALATKDSREEEEEEGRGNRVQLQRAQSGFCV